MSGLRPDLPARQAMAVSADGRRAAGGRRMLRLGVRVLIAGVLLAAWQLATSAAASPYFPPPTAIVARMRQTWLGGPPQRLFLSADAVANVLPSVGRLAAGWSIALVGGVGFGLLLGRSPRTLDYLNPVLRLARATPPATLVPVFIAIFHLGARMEVATIAFGACWPILVNAIEGARRIDAVRVETALVYRLGPLRRLCYLILPASLPQIFAGLRVSTALALILMVLSELVGGSDGIGYALNTAQQSFDMPGLWAAIVLTGLLGYACNAALLAVERGALAWHRASGHPAD